MTESPLFIYVVVFLMAYTAGMVTKIFWTQSPTIERKLQEVDLVNADLQQTLADYQMEVKKNDRLNFEVTRLRHELLRAQTKLSETQQPGQRTRHD